MKNRELIIDLLPRNSIGCELGVFEGDFSQVLLDSKKFKELHLVDPFYGSIESGDKNGHNIKTYEGNFLFDKVSNRFQKNDAVRIHRKTSIDFLLSSVDNYFDFIYIDTTHQYKQTLDELNLSLKKIKNNGIISGHDYNHELFMGVVSAVDAFSKDNNLQLHLTTEDKLATFYFFIKK